MTLAAFARQMGLDPATVRQWKKRGKIVERDGGYVLCDESVTGLDGLRLERDSSVTPERDKPIEALSRMEVLERDNRILSDAVDSLRDLTTEQGMKISDLQRQMNKLRGSLIDSNNFILQLQADKAALLDRVTALESAQPAGSRGILGGKTNYTGSAASVGEPFHD